MEETWTPVYPIAFAVLLLSMGPGCVVERVDLLLDCKSVESNNWRSLSSVVIKKIEGIGMMLLLAENEEASFSHFGMKQALIARGRSSFAVEEGNSW